MKKPNFSVVGLFNLLWRSTPAKLALCLIALLALLFVLLGGPPAGALAQDEPTATETLAAFDSETPTATDTLEEPTASEEPTLAADTATEEPTVFETLAESETPTVDLSLTVTPTITETPTETPTETVTVASCEGLGVDELCAVAAAEGAVRVIVELDMNYTPPSQLSDAAENAQKNAIQNNQNALEAEMNAAEITNPEVVVEAGAELETLPFVSYVVDEAGLAELVESPLVAAIHPDHRSTLFLDTSVSLIGATTTHSYGFTGAGETIAILDTGVMSSHDMFAGGKVVSEACYSWEQADIGADSLCAGDADSDNGGIEGAGTAPQCVSSFSGCDHGTHVAGIAAGDDGGSHIGVAPAANIIAIQVFTELDSTWGCGSGCIAAFDFEIIMGLERVLALQGTPGIPDIAAVNMSLGGNAYAAVCDSVNDAFVFAPPMKLAIDNLRAAGIATVIASGNNGFTSKVSYPACISTSVSVGATNDLDQLALAGESTTFTNRASFLSLYAPGDFISSASTDGNSLYELKSGTSMAAPHVAGAFALIQDFANGLMSVTDALNYFKNNGDPVTGVSTYTKPRINVLNAFRAASVNTVAPTLLTIANNGYSPNDSTPTLTWGGVNPNAVDYEIQIDTTNTFVAPLSYSLVDNFPGETATTSALLDGIYYWRVRALNQYDAAGPWSTIFKFTVDTILPANVTLSLPADASTINTIVPKLTWLAATGAVKYQVQVSEDGTWTTIDLDHTTATAVLFYQLTNAQALHAELQYWRVRAIDIAGNPSALWTQRTFTPLLLQSPANGAFTTDQTPLLKWFAATGALNIEVELDNNADFLSPEVDPVPFAATLLQYQAPDLALGLQYWRLRIETTAGGWSEWSPVWTFTISNPAPAITVLVSPLANALTNDAAPDLDWNAAAGADHYQLQIDDTMTMASPEVDNSAVPSDAATSPPLGQGAQYWRVRAIDSLNQPGPWSLVRKFTVDSLPPVAPVLMLPADGAPSAGNPNFTWTKAAEVTQSQVQIDFDACDFGSVESSFPWVATTAFKPTTAQWDETGLMCWRVVGRDAAGNEAISLTSRTVTINELVPIAPGPITLANMAITSNPTPVFNWGGVAYAANYEIQIDNASTFMSLDGGEIDTDTTYTPAALTDGLYYWRVRGINSGATAGPFSTVRTFTVDTIAPPAPDLTSPINGANSVGNPTFMWTKPLGSTQYMLEIDIDNDGFDDYSSAWMTVNSFKPTVAQFSTVGPVDWRVLAKDAAGNPSGPSLSRELTIKIPLPAAPILVAPPTGTLSQQEPLLDWNASANGVFYRIQIATDATFTALAHEQDLDPGITDFTHGGLPDGTYYWRVAGWNGNTPTEMGPYSLVRTFKLDDTNPPAPILSLPLNAAISTGNPTFTWMAAAGATQYRLQIDADDFASPYQSNWMAVTSFKPTALQFSELGGLEWRVIARDAAGNESTPSVERSLTINVPVPPNVPTLALPPNNSFTNDPTPNFVWSAVPYGDHYEIWVDTSSTFAAPHIIDFEGAAGSMNLNYELGTTVDPGTPVVPPAFLLDGKYYWWVWGFNNASPTPQHSAAWSSIFSFTVDTQDPAAPNLIMPIAGADIRATGLVLKWQAVTGATRYRVEVDQSGGDFTAPDYFSPTPINGTTFTLPIFALPVGAYEWRVIAIDAALNESVPSEERPIDIIEGLPIAPVLVSPATNFMTTDNTPTFTWNAVGAWADTYEIQIDNNNTFASPEATGSGLVGLNFTSSLIPNGTYYWRVGALNSSADGLVEAGPWSLVRILKIVP